MERLMYSPTRLDTGWRHWFSNRQVPHILGLLPSILGAIPEWHGSESPRTWIAHQVRATSTGTIVITAGPAPTQPRVVVKFSKGVAPAQSLQRHYEAVKTLHAENALVPLRIVLPRPLAFGRCGAYTYEVEEALGGSEMASFDAESPEYARAYRLATNWLHHLHRETAHPLTVTAEILDFWVDQRLERVQQITDLLPYARRSRRALQWMWRTLREALQGRTLTASWIHGDYWPGNILIGDDGAVTGLIDWDQASPSELPAHDLIHLMFHAPSASGKRHDLSTMVQTALSRPNWSYEQRRALELAAEPITASLERTPDCLGYQDTLLLYWLRYVAMYAERCPARARRGPWAVKNLVRVLGCIDREVVS